MAIATNVDFSYPVLDIQEGAAHLLVPNVPRRKGPGTAGPWPFFNPTMAVNRDLSGAILRRWPHPLRSVLDGLAGTGAWGIRMALETSAKGLTFNDRFPSATDLLRTNVQRNAVDANVSTDDLVHRLQTATYDFVDIDPFGTPTPFLDAAIESAPIPSGLGVTATDAAVLCGTYPATCRKRYGASSSSAPQRKEIGVRILLAYCDRLAAKHGKAIRPILSVAAEHFLRVLVVVEGKQRTSRVGGVERRSPGEFVIRSRIQPPRKIGPLWLGPLYDGDLVRAAQPSEWTGVPAARLLAMIQGEADLPPFFVTTDELARQLGGPQPRIGRFIEGLRAIGYRAARTHFHPYGVKTDAPHADVQRVFREQGLSGSMGGSAPAS